MRREAPRFPAPGPGVAPPGVLLVVGREKQELLAIKTFSIDPPPAPKGQSVVETMFMSDDFTHGSELRENRATYSAEKEWINAATTEAIEQVIPRFAAVVEVVDAATPATSCR